MHDNIATARKTALGKRREGIMPRHFGALLKRFRLRANLGLRSFAELVEIKPSNLSAMEHGRRGAPEDDEKLRRIADSLGLVEGSSDWVQFFDAAKQPRRLPSDVQHLGDRKLIPTLLRTIDNLNLDDDAIERLIEDVNSK